MIKWLLGKTNKNRSFEAQTCVQEARVARDRGDFSAAIVLFDKALRLDSQCLELRLEYGNALAAAGDKEAAELVYRHVLACSPQLVGAHRALGRLLIELARYAEAVDCFRVVLEAEPDSRHDLISAAYATYFVFDFFAARKFLAQAHQQMPLDIPERFMLGMAYLNCGLLEDAEQVFVEASSLAPDEPKLLELIGTVRLMKGDWKNGFALYERRHDALRRNHPGSLGVKWLDCVSAVLKDIPVWQGEPLRGKRLLLWMEQGFGDNIMMLRLLRELQERWGAETLAIFGNEPLRRVVEHLGNVQFITAWPGEKVSEDFSGFDLQCSLLSLPCLLDVERDAVPGSAPWIKIPEALNGKWNNLLSASHGLKVGLVWAGNPFLQFDSLRSVELNLFAPLFFLEGVSFFSLQEGADSRLELQRQGFPVIDHMSACADFMDTAALVNNLDLVIAVDTAVAHLAGALNVPVWLLNRFESEWRWLRDREKSAWYPSMKIFNQDKPRDWAGVIDRVGQELNRITKNRAFEAGVSSPFVDGSCEDIYKFKA